MSKTMWIRNLDEVLMHETKKVELISSSNGNKYIADIIPVLTVTAIASVEEIDGKFKYSVVDIANDLEYSIKTENKVEAKFGTSLRFKSVRGGTTSNGLGWYSADSVEIVQKNA